MEFLDSFTDNPTKIAYLAIGITVILGYLRAAFRTRSWLNICRSKYTEKETIRILRDESWSCLIHETIVVVVLNLAMRTIMGLSPVENSQWLLFSLGMLSTAWVVILVHTTCRFQARKKP